MWLGNSEQNELLLTAVVKVELGVLCVAMGVVAMKQQCVGGSQHHCCSVADFEHHYLAVATVKEVYGEHTTAVEVVAVHYNGVD